MLFEDGLNDRLLGDAFAGLRCLLARILLGFEVVDMEAQDVAVLDGVGDRVGVELLLEEVFRGPHGGRGVFDLPQGGVLLEDGCAGKAEELGLGEELFDGLVIFAEL